MTVALVAALAAAPMMGAAQPSTGPQQVNLITSAVELGAALVQAAFRLPAGAAVDDFLNVFVAEIATSGAAQNIVMSAIDGAIATPGLPVPAVQALQILRRRLARRKDYTGAVDDTALNGPSFGGGGGSDYSK